MRSLSLSLGGFFFFNFERFQAKRLFTPLYCPEAFGDISLEDCGGTNQFLHSSILWRRGNKHPTLSLNNSHKKRISHQLKALFMPLLLVQIGHPNATTAYLDEDDI
ncbi:hypothetical protein VNO77_03001 [Canavalia gladiata]|uniref:Uncharacterized protein n=1 Tax=Canavalia gladiata TaxID=3824 RepID=A0AAN9R3H2_CANGL